MLSPEERWLIAGILALLLFGGVVKMCREQVVEKDVGESPSAKCGSRCTTGPAVAKIDSKRDKERQVRNKAVTQPCQIEHHENDISSAHLVKIFGLMVAIAIQPLPAPATTASPSELLEKGIYNEETKGDLDSAIKIYEELVAAVKTSQSLAAQAQFRLAQCYLKKNKTTEANAAFEKLIHVSQMKRIWSPKACACAGRLCSQSSAVGRWRAAASSDLKLPAGLNLGVMVYHADLAEPAGGKSGVSAQTLVGGASGFARRSVDADADTRPYQQPLEACSAGRCHRDLQARRTGNESSRRGQNHQGHLREDRLRQ